MVVHRVGFGAGAVSLISSFTTHYVPCGGTTGAKALFAVQCRRGRLTGRECIQVGFYEACDSAQFSKLGWGKAERTSPNTPRRRNGNLATSKSHPQPVQPLHSVPCPVQGTARKRQSRSVLRGHHQVAESAGVERRLQRAPESQEVSLRLGHLFTVNIYEGVVNPASAEWFSLL